MKKLLALVLAAALCCLCFAGCGGSSSNEKVVKIGIFEPASGNNGAGGKQEALGVK